MADHDPNEFGFDVRQRRLGAVFAHSHIESQGSVLLKVLFVALRWDYKDPRRGPSFEYTNLWESLDRMPGVDADLFAFDEVEAHRGRDQMNRDLLAQADEVDPDLIFFVLFEDEFLPGTILKLSERYRTLNWFTDDHWRFDVFSREWAPRFTWITTTDAQALERYRSIGCDRVLRTQWGCNHHSYRPLDLPADLSVTFVGQPHGDRRAFLEKLRTTGIDVQTWGHGWPKGRVDQDEMIRIFNRSKINLNLSNASAKNHATRVRWLAREMGRSPSLFLHPKRLIRSYRALQRQQVKARNFEVPGCGGLLLTQELPELNEYYVPQAEVATYSSFDDLVDRCRYFLSDDAARLAVAQAGLRRTLADHTYERRFSDLFAAMGTT